MNLAFSQKKYIQGTFALGIEFGQTDRGPGKINFYKFAVQYFRDHFDELKKKPPQDRIFLCFAKKHLATLPKHHEMRSMEVIALLTDLKELKTSIAIMVNEMKGFGPMPGQTMEAYHKYVLIFVSLNLML